jgi:hypothetical protein
VCAAAAVFPPLMELCIAASTAFLVFQSALAVCLIWIEFCNTYYNSGN